MPRYLGVRAVLESAWADTFASRPTGMRAGEEGRDVDAALRWFEADLNPAFMPWSDRPSPPGSADSSLDWATTLTFGECSIAQQRLLLFLRAVVHKPDLIVLDEAFAGMEPALRDKCLHFLEVGEDRTRRSSGLRRGTSTDMEAWRLPPLSEDGNGIGMRHTGLSERQGLIVVSHVREEVPDVVSHWMVLPGDGEGTVRMGTVAEGRSVAEREVWEEIWGMKVDE